MATILQTGIPGVGTGILHPRHKNRFRVTFANLGGGTDSQPLSMQVTTFERPKLTFNKVELHRYNSVAYVAGKHSWDPVQMVIQDDQAGTASTVITEQLQRQQNLVGASGAAWLATAPEGAAYKFVSYVDMLDGNDQVLERWTLEGSWFENVGWGDLDYSTGDPVEITVSLCFDHARQTVFGYSGGEGLAIGGAGA